MINLNVSKGDRISFTYDCPKTGPATRTGTVEKFVRTAKHDLLTMTIFDDNANQFRSFHFNKMRDIKVQAGV